MSSNDSILDEFLIEANEIFDQLDLDYVELEKDPQSTKLIGKIFRAMHTLKGSSRFFSYLRLEKLAHSGAGCQ
jgi:two-component system chemotaxis sensor kinase CheA